MDFMDERKYLAVSIKHSREIGWKFDNSKSLVFWGYKRTKDDEERCFSNYTTHAGRAELYSLNDFKKYDPIGTKCDAAVSIFPEMLDTFKNYDTVLISKDAYLQYLATTIDQRRLINFEIEYENNGLPKGNPYTLKVDDTVLYVLTDDECLYKIKENVSDDIKFTVFRASTLVKYYDELKEYDHGDFNMVNNHVLVSLLVSPNLYNKLEIEENKNEK